MAGKTWTLTDVDADIYQEQIVLGPEQVGGSARGYSVVKRRLYGGRRDGVDVIEVNNGRLSFVIVPTRGMSLWRASCGDLQLGWKSPVKGPVHPSFVPLWEGSGIGWLGGFDELMVRCGLENNGGPVFAANGALQHPLHGRIGNIPADKVEVTIDGDAGEIVVTGVVDEARMFSQKLRLTATIRTKIGTTELTVSDEIENLSAEPGELELLYHTNFGVPLLGPGAKVSVPARRVVPRESRAMANLPEWNVYGPETEGLGEACFFFDLLADASGRTRATLRSADGTKGVSVKFNTKQLPYFTVWKQRQCVPDGYVTGLEPSINFPNEKTFEKAKGRVAVLKSGEKRHFEVSIEAHPDAASLAAAEKEIAAIQGETKLELVTTPVPEWIPD
jgi:galactose mutarotase-like enzyme